MRALAVDWSGSVHGAQRRIWLAEASAPDTLSQLECGRDRAALQTLLTRLRGEAVVGLDFGFAFPAWFTRELGYASGPELWRHVAEHGEAWLARCDAPFWGRPGKGRRGSQPALRRTEQDVARAGAGFPKSVFQIGGAGSVGTGSIRGMPMLLALREAGASIWPFDAPGWPLVVEIYPRLLTGPVVKSSAAARAALLDARYPHLHPVHRASAVASEDAFDAAVSALEMYVHLDELRSLPPETDPDHRLEGRIWCPQRLAEVRLPAGESLRHA